MSLSGILNSIKSKIETVTSVGKVSLYRRWVNTESAFNALFKTTINSTPYIRAWVVDRVRLTDERVAFPQSKKRVHTISIEGYHSIDSGTSESDFQALIDSVCDALRSLGKLTYEGSDNALYAEMPQVVVAGDFRAFGSVIAHYCEIQVNVIVRDQVSG